jgi:hypothetical protein
MKKVKEKIKDIYFLIRYYIYTLSLKIIYKLGVKPKTFDEVLKEDGKYLYYETRKIKLSSIYYRYKNFKLDDKKCSDYSIKEWEELILDIKTNGIINTPISYIKPFCEIKNTQYYLEDGNHRLKALEILYGKDYNATIDCYASYNFIKYKKQNKKSTNKIIKDKYEKNISIIKNKTYK